MTILADRVVWITGAGSGIGRAAAVAMGREGAQLVLSGRREAALGETASLVEAAGGRDAVVAAGDMGVSADVERISREIGDRFGRCDVLVNSAGMNVPNRSWKDVDVDGIDAVIAADLAGPFYTSRAVLPLMRARRDGLIVQISSWAGRFVSPLTGPAYAAAKHGLNALSESINQEECGNGIRSCCICPGEVATPILDKRPVPVSPEDRARMLQAEHVAAAILFVATMPASVCVNEILISPTWNRGYLRDGR